MDKLARELRVFFLGSGSARVHLVLGWARYHRDRGHLRLASMLLRWLERNHGSMSV